MPEKKSNKKEDKSTRYVHEMLHNGTCWRKSQRKKTSRRGTLMKCVITGMPEKESTKYVNRMNHSGTSSTAGQSSGFFGRLPISKQLVQHASFLPGTVDVPVLQQEVLERWIKKDGRFNVVTNLCCWDFYRVDWHGTHQHCQCCCCQLLLAGDSDLLLVGLINHR